MLTLLLNRELIQSTSFFLLITAAATAVLTDYLLPSVALVGLSIWIVIISESFLLSKIQLEMQSALEDISRKKEREVEEVLFFLRQSQIACSPFESLEGAKRLCRQTSFPSMVMTPDYQIIAANKQMHSKLGWKHGELIGIPAYTINVPIIMSKIGEYASKPDKVADPSIVSYYAYNSKSGEKITGIMMASKVGVEGFLVKFIPESDLVLTQQQVQEMVVKND